MGRPGNEACLGEAQFLLGLSYGSSRPKCLTDCRTHRAGALRTERDKGATHTLVVTEPTVGVTEGDHGLRRGSPTNSGETAEVNDQISKQATSLCPPPLSPPVMDTHYLPNQSTSFWAVPMGGKLYLIRSQNLSRTAHVSPYSTPWTMQNQSAPCLPRNSPASIQPSTLLMRSHGAAMSYPSPP